MKDHQVKAVAYARVSTVIHGQDPEHQLVPIRKMAKGRGFQLINEHVDYVSGTKSKRAELEKVIRGARLGEFNVIIIYALDRMARDVRFLLNLLHELDSYGVAVISLREAIDLSTPLGKAVTQVLGAMAELERNLLSERVKTALAVKRLAAEKNGTDWRVGRPKIPNEVKEKVLKLRKEGLSIRKIAEVLKEDVGCSTVGKVVKNANL